MNDRTIAARGYHWTTVEVAVLREHYASPNGPARCAELLPHRGLYAVYMKARLLGLRAPPGGTAGKRFARKYPASAEVDNAIREGYMHMVGRGAVARLALAVGRPKWWVTRRAEELGLARMRVQARPWTREEVALLDAWASCTTHTIRAKLAAAGFARTQTAIAVKLKRLGMDRTDPDTWSARELGTLLGVDGATVADWVARRGLKAERDPHGPHGIFRITRRALRAWMKATQCQLVDLRRVDQTWFKELSWGREA